jgi:hypothetical protein
MKFGLNKRSCIARQRQEEKRSHVRQYYRDDASTDWNLDMVMTC